MRMRMRIGEDQGEYCDFITREIHGNCSWWRILKLLEYKNDEPGRLNGFETGRSITLIVTNRRQLQQSAATLADKGASSNHWRILLLTGVASSAPISHIEYDLSWFDYNMTRNYNWISMTLTFRWLRTPLDEIRNNDNDNNKTTTIIRGLKMSKSIRSCSLLSYYNL